MRFYLAGEIALRQGSDADMKPSEEISNGSTVNRASSSGLVLSYIEYVFYDDKQDPKALLKKHLPSLDSNARKDILKKAGNNVQDTTDPDFWKLLEFPEILNTGTENNSTDDTIIRRFQTTFTDLLQKWAKTSLRVIKPRIIEQLKENCRTLILKFLMNHYHAG